MGSDLVVHTLEIGPRTRPDFKKARRAIARLGEQELVNGFCRAVQLGMKDAWGTYAASHPQDADPSKRVVRGDIARKAREYAAKGLEALEAMWKGDRRDAFVIELRRSVVLIAGGTSWGDPPFEEYDEVMVAEHLGLARAAGFWQ